MPCRSALVMLAALTLTSGLAALASATKPLPARPQALPTTLTEIREMRKHEAVTPSEDDFVFPHEREGLFLEFRVAVPEGLTLLELAQPDAITATDSAGNDLTQIEESFMGGKEHVELQHAFDEPPTDFTVTLATPARAATSFTLKTRLNATLFANTESRTIPAPSEWTPLPPELTGGAEVKVRVDGDGESANLHIDPGTARSLFEEITLTGASGEFDSMGSMWSDAQATFYFNGAFEDGMRVTYTIRVGLTTIPVTLSLQNVALP